MTIRLLIAALKFFRVWYAKILICTHKSTFWNINGAKPSIVNGSDSVSKGWVEGCLSAFSLQQDYEGAGNAPALLAKDTDGNGKWMLPEVKGFHPWSLAASALAKQPD